MLTPAERRRKRDTLLGSGAIAFAGAVLLILIGDLLLLIHVTSTDGYPLGTSVAQGFSLGGDMLLIAALTLAGIALLAGPIRREWRLARATVLLGAAFAAALVDDAVTAGVDSDAGVAGTEVASRIIGAIGALAGVGAAVIAARGFLTAARTPPENQAARDGHLGWTSSCLVVTSALGLTAEILTSVFYSDLGAATNLTDGLGVASAGYGITIPGAALAAIAFFLSRRRQLRGEGDWHPRRDRMLGVGIGIFSLGLLLTGIGGMMVVGAYGQIGVHGIVNTAAWLAAVGLLGVAGAAACVSIGFLRSAPLPPAQAPPQS